MGFDRFGFLLGMRMIFIMATLTAVCFLIVAPGHHPATLLALGITAGLTFDLFKFVSKTNREVSRFLDAARYADFGQRFEFTRLGGGFTELGNAFTLILDRFREDRKQRESELRHLKALLEHVPVPLISVHSDNHITLWNNSARRLFGTAQVTRVSDLEKYGSGFRQQITSLKPGERLLVSFLVDNSEQNLTISASEITIASSTEKLISLQNIQSELDSMQLNAWQDLVRVLTHEIMNSITPVASLAKTAVDVVDDVAEKVGADAEMVEGLQVVRDAVN
ncbi:MAG: PAS domain-containing protein, partial [Gammaproteobacteria bacterium]|nr:PAS domain-containing protein [Gammaproteobacteria bacterium]